MNVLLVQCLCGLYVDVWFLFSAQVKVFVTGLFSLNQDIPAFKEHLRDFLVQIKVCHFLPSRFSLPPSVTKPATNKITLFGSILISRIHFLSSQFGLTLKTALNNVCQCVENATITPRLFDFRSLRVRTPQISFWRRGRRLCVKPRRRNTKSRCPCPESSTPTSSRRRCANKQLYSFTLLKEINAV